VDLSATTVRLLRAAAEIVGGNKALADRLGVNDALLAKFMADRHVLPDPLLLRAVDIILADRQFRLPYEADLPAKAAQDTSHGG
jgi:hypothetical protein